MISLLHPDLHYFFEEYPSGEHKTYFIYALADAAQDSWFLKKNSHLHYRNLLTEAAGDKAAEISPHLVQLGHNHNIEWQYISKRMVGTPRLTLIISPLDFDSLYSHLRQFLNVQFESGLEMYLAFWDPAILGTLVGQISDQTLYVKQQVLSDQQKKVLLEPIHSWWYWDRKDKLHKIIGGNGHESLKFYDWQNPFTFTPVQEDMMVEASFPDHLIYYLNLNNPFLVEDFKEWELYPYVVKKIALAREYGLEGTRDILNFICLTLIYKNTFEQDELLQSVLLKVQNKMITIDQAMEDLERLVEENE